jgi:thioredoxin reductase (NADPH)
MLIRGDSISKSMSQYLIDQIAATPNIEVRTNTQVVAVEGDGRLEYLHLSHAGTRSVEPADALFTFIGAAPRTGWLPAEIARDEHGFVLTGADLTGEQLTAAGRPDRRPPLLLETSVPGVFATGDVRAGAMRRVASAVGEGAMAVAFTHRYLAAT